MSPFRDWRASEPGSPARLEAVDQPPRAASDALVHVACSALSRADALALTGAQPAPVGAPLGQDLAGRVLLSDQARCRPGERVVATGRHPLRSFMGGLAERACLVALMQAVRRGTSGYDG